jgi:hypothetical protein
MGFASVYPPASFNSQTILITGVPAHKAAGALTETCPKQDCEKYAL